MWRAVNTLVRRPYTYSESKDVAGILKRFSVREPAEPKPTTASTPPALSRLLQDAWRAGSAIVIVQPPDADHEGEVTPDEEASTAS